MASYTVIENSSVLIDLPTDFSDNGWRISEEIATHSGCNAGYITLKNTDSIIADTGYRITYEVLNHVSGSVNVEVGGESGVSRLSDGVYSEILTSGDTQELKFYADGGVSIKYLEYHTIEEEETDNSITLAFNENANKFVTYYSFIPEMMIKFGNSLFTTKDGQLWEHDVNEVRNNFYGLQYASKITFYVSMNPSQIKDFFSIRVQSNKAWASKNKGDIYIMPVEGKSKGMSSRLKKGRFNNYGGDFFADFLRNMDDPRFVDELEALMKGAPLQGKVMKITIENDDTGAVKLFAVDIDMMPHSLTR